MGTRIGLKNTADITFFDLKTKKEVMHFNNFPLASIEIKKEMEKPIYYLIELDKKVDDVAIEYFNGIGLYVALYEIEDKPNWLVVRWQPPHLIQTIEKMSHVVSVQRVNIELGGNKHYGTQR